MHLWCETVHSKDFRWESKTNKKSQTMPPKIINFSRDIVVNEGSNVTLMCQANGKPEPSISWKFISNS
ncbi:hypothetical protein CCH79_00016137, partial [Gambusia affinis]